MAFLMFVCGGLFPRIYDVDGATRELATRFIAVAAVWMPFCSYSHCSYFTLRSGGKTLVTFLFDSVFTWIVVAPLAFVLVRYTGLGIVAVYFCVQGTELIKNIMGYFMVKSDVWLVQMV
jgi:Na+-driven multidrug efflux pump